jgi:predicted phosphodiesterase
MKQAPQTPLLVQARVGVVGDIHTEVEMLEWALGVLAAQNVERVLATGDIVDGPQDGAAVARVCKLLREVDAVAVLGNHDRWLLDDTRRDLPLASFADEIDQPSRAYLQSLPVSVDILTPLGLMAFGHGLGPDDMAALYPYDHGPALTRNATLQKLLRPGHYQLALSGHTHHRMVRKLNGVTFINAGAIGSTREPCCMVIDFHERRVQFYDRAADRTTQLGPSFDL